ncbi:hypothetical protein FHU13_005042 [Methylobacterium sp. R2-1]|nr:hypothetical protein [Methylobacterium sp. R2-1]
MLDAHSLVMKWQRWPPHLLLIPIALQLLQQLS